MYLNPQLRSPPQMVIKLLTQHLPTQKLSGRGTPSRSQPRLNQITTLNHLQPSRKAWFIAQTLSKTRPLTRLLNRLPGTTAGVQRIKDGRTSQSTVIQECRIIILDAQHLFPLTEKRRYNRDTFSNRTTSRVNGWNGLSSLGGAQQRGL